MLSSYAGVRVAWYVPGMNIMHRATAVSKFLQAAAARGAALTPDDLRAVQYTHTMQLQVAGGAVAVGAPTLTGDRVRLNTIVTANKHAVVTLLATVGADEAHAQYATVAEALEFIAWVACLHGRPGVRLDVRAELDRMTPSVVTTLDRVLVVGDAE